MLALASSISKHEEYPIISTNAISTTGLTKSYGRTAGSNRLAVDDLSLDVPKGSVFGLLGPNGAGKTTTIMMLLGIIRPTRGQFSLFGKSMSDIDVRKQIGYVPEKFQLPGYLKADEFLRYHGRLFGLDVRTLDRRVEDLLQRVGLLERARTPIVGFSKGMQQRLTLAQALIHDPELVILDEPTSALDPIGRKDVRQIVEDLRSRGKTVLLNSHILSDVEQVCDAVAIMRQGRIERQGPISALTSHAVTLHLRVGDCSPELLQAIAKLGTGFQSQSSDAISELSLSVTDEEVASHAASLVHQAGSKLYSLVPTRESLEDLFIRVIEEER